MNDLVNNQKTDLISLIHNDPHSLDLTKPFQRDILLFQTDIAGTSFIKNFKQIKSELKIDQELLFLREPNNPHDKDAIVIQTQTGQKLGYVPAADNPVFSRLMDAGKYLFGKIVSIEDKNNWSKIEINIFLRD